MRILFIRHAHAAQGVGEDFDRELSVDGLRQAEKVARSLQHLDLSQFEIFISAAKRTVETWNTIAQILNITNPVHLSDDLYSADSWIYRQIIFNADYQNLVFVGHNPAISMSLSDFTRSDIQLLTGEWALVQFDRETSEGFVESHFTHQESF